jgi:signal transduction histidine kinase
MRGLSRIFWPKSLYGQILFVAASALLIAQVINATLLLAGTRSRSVAEATTTVVIRVANQIERQQERAFEFGTEAGGRALPGTGRRRRGPPMTTLVTRQPISIARYDNQPEFAGRADEFFAASNLELSGTNVSVGSVKLLPKELREPLLRRYMLGKMRQRQRPEPQLAVLMSTRAPDGRWINAAALVRRTDAGSLVALILQTLLLYIAVLIPLALVARRIAKPLAHLNDRVERVGLADEIAPLEAKGPSDVRQLIVSFNAMQARVSALLGEKDVMLGAIGHDLKTPLAALRVRIESVEDESERNKMASTIDEMATILDDILTLARLGKSGESSQKTDIGALVGSVSADYPQAKLIEPQSRIVAFVRPILLRRALRNLIGNAIIYGREATISVEQSCGQLRVIIDDNGPGIAPDSIDLMFEPFARAESSRNRSTGGSGLGLTIARAIARSHNGDIVLENRTEGGLRASLIMPV